MYNHFTSVTSCHGLHGSANIIVVKANSQTVMGMGKFRPFGAPKPLKRFRWNLDYCSLQYESILLLISQSGSGMCRWGYDQKCKSMWRCDNVGGIVEHVTCHMLRFLSIIKQNWNQFLLVVKATALKQQISKFYPHIQGTDARNHMYVS